MSDICTDNRFELIEKYKKKLIESTNIETAQDEMAVLDNLLFRFWQMGWLDRLERPEIIRCKDCKHQEKFFQKDGRRKDGGYYIYGCYLAEEYSHVCLDDDYCSRAERKERKADETD